MFLNMTILWQLHIKVCCEGFMTNLKTEMFPKPQGQSRWQNFLQGAMIKQSTEIIGMALKSLWVARWSGRPERGGYVKGRDPEVSKGTN